MNQTGMGWKPSTDPRNRLWLVRAAMTPVGSMTAELLNFKMHWANGWWGDQKSTPHCVIYSWLHLFADGPITHPTIHMPFQDPKTLYDTGLRIDGSPVNSQDGLTCLAGAKVMQNYGIMREYRWSYTLKDTLDALAFTPVTLGCWWYTGMFQPDSKGLVRISGVKEGGHQVILNGFNRKTRRVRGKNSWGRDWGRFGHFEMSFDDLERHYDEGAETCVATELLKWRMPEGV